MTIQIQQLSIGYPSKRGVRIVAEGISGAIRSGELTCLLGANGVGKSTLLRTLSAFQPKIGGEVLIQGRDLAGYTDKELSRLIGVVLTEKPDIRNMTVRELVSLGRSPYTDFWGNYSKEDLQIVDESIHQVGIENLSRQPIQTLSDGERQKVMIAKALAQQTPVIYLDEPTAFLDYPSKVEVLQLLRCICSEANKTVFLSTHDVELALQLADTVWLMTREHGVKIGSPQQLAHEGALSRFIEREGITFDAETLAIRVRKGN
jgi:iron complex transport system ATP-binding protein